MDFEKAYRCLPIRLQNLAVTIEGLRIRRKRFDGQFRRLLADYEGRTFWKPKELEAYRDERLNRFCRLAVQQVPYYRDRFKKANARPEEIHRLEDLAGLPILAKEEVRHRPEVFRSESHARDIIWSHTSGTTGAGLRFPTTNLAHREQWAVWWRYRRWFGLDVDSEVCLYFGGRSVVPPEQTAPPYWRYDRLARCIYFSGYHLSAETATAYLDEISKYSGVWIHGYPSLVSLLCSLSLSSGRTIGNARWVTLGAESVLPHQIALIRNATQVEPIQHYGMAEGVANISLCPMSRLHVDEDFSAVELVAIGDGQYRILGTNFTNDAFPLIRYDTGDIATLSDEICSCGRAGRTVEKIDGRVEDYVITTSRRLIGRLDHIFKDLANIREAQIQQEHPGAIRIAVVKTPQYSETDETSLYREVEKRLGREMKVEITYVDQLPRTAAGKLRLVVSKISSAELMNSNHMSLNDKAMMPQ